MTTLTQIDFGQPAEVTLHDPAPRVLVLCEHASNWVPEDLKKLGLTDASLQTHIAWDPGAAPVAQALTSGLGGICVTGSVSRLVYDCNRPPDAPSAMPERSEIYDIPGNTDLTPDQRKQRVEGVYVPFCNAVKTQLSEHRDTVALIVTVHSFNPIYKGQPREVEIGILHGADPGFAHAMMRHVPNALPFITKLNAPYSAADGVAHSLDLHGHAHGLPNVMIEIRNDLIRTKSAQTACAALLADWIEATAVSEGILK